MIAPRFATVIFLVSTAQGQTDTAYLDSVLAAERPERHSS
jgi:hypothetical protein